MLNRDFDQWHSDFKYINVYYYTSEVFKILYIFFIFSIKENRPIKPKIQYK